MIGFSIKLFVLYKILTKLKCSIIVLDNAEKKGITNDRSIDMNQTTHRDLNAEDRLISRMTLSFLSAPLLFLLLVGAALAI